MRNARSALLWNSFFLNLKDGMMVSEESVTLIWVFKKHLIRLQNKCVEYITCLDGNRLCSLSVRS
jgi:hypothetical protein